MAAGQPLRGLVGQSISGRRAQAQVQQISFFDTTSSGSYQVQTDCIAFVGLFGGGAGGQTTTSGGDGGDGVYSLISLQPLWTLTWSAGAGGTAGNPGGDSTLSWPSGSMRARGGNSTGLNLGQYVSLGGKGGSNANGTAGADGGGSGGNNPGSTGGGGGGAGLLSKFPGFTQGGAGGDGSGGNEPGHAPSGGGAGTPAVLGAGAAGRVLIIILRVV